MALMTMNAASIMMFVIRRFKHRETLLPVITEVLTVKICMILIPSCTRKRSAALISWMKITP